MFTLATGCFGQEISVKDDAGARLALARPAQRIVALAPNLAELVFAAGAGDKLVAASRYSDYPPQVQRLPQVADAFAINFEALIALKPDLVLVWQSGTPERQRLALHALAKREGFVVFESEIHNVAGIADTLERMGELAGTARPAHAAASKVLHDWQALKSRYQAQRPVRVFYQVWDAPLMTFNRQHIVSQAIRACGGTQGFDHVASLTPTISREAVLAFNPQLILAGSDGDTPAALAAWRRLPEIDAVQHHQLHTANAALLSRMGPRFVQAAAQLCATIERARETYTP